MANINFELKDANGVDTEIGDTIKIIFPENEIWNSHDDELEYYCPYQIVKAKVLLPPSKGLQIRIIEILYIDNENSDDYNNYMDNNTYYRIYLPGGVHSFHRTVLEWYKL